LKQLALGISFLGWMELEEKGDHRSNDHPELAISQMTEEGFLEKGIGEFQL
jgi:hypothetical protein